MALSRQPGWGARCGAQSWSHETHLEVTGKLNSSNQSPSFRTFRLSLQPFQESLPPAEEKSPTSSWHQSARRGPTEGWSARPNRLQLVSVARALAPVSYTSPSQGRSSNPISSRPSSQGVDVDVDAKTQTQAPSAQSLDRKSIPTAQVLLGSSPRSPTLLEVLKVGHLKWSILRMTSSNNLTGNQRHP